MCPSSSPCADHPPQAELAPFKNLKRLWFIVRPIRFHDMCSTILSVRDAMADAIMGSPSGALTSPSLLVLLVARLSKPRTALRALLISSGYQIVVRDHGMHATELMNSQKFGAVVICSPLDMQGPELCAEVRAWERSKGVGGKIPIVAVVAALDGFEHGRYVIPSVQSLSSMAPRSRPSAHRLASAPFLDR